MRFLGALFAEVAEQFGSAEIHFADSSGTDYLCGYSEGTVFESGNAVIAIGADSVTDRRTYYFTDDGLHLDPNDERARQQAETLVNFMTEEAPAHPLVLAGDLNATPDFFRSSTYAPEQGGEGEFYEADHPDNQGTFRDGSKIDYVFGHQGGFTAEVAAEVVEPGNCPAFPFIDHPCSDHNAVFGTLRLR